MKKFDIHTHVLDHAHSTVGVIENHDKNCKLEHFNTSIDTAYFIARNYTTQEQIDAVMTKIMNNISKRAIEVNEKNGIYVDKKGNLNQKYRTRIIKFDDLLIVYHNQHYDASKSVNPHFHFLIPPKARVGIGYMYLMKALTEQAIQYGLKFNFMEPSQETNPTKTQLEEIEELSWHLQQGRGETIKKYFDDRKGLVRTLDMLVDHYRQTLNISFYIKIFKVLNQRLNEFNLDFEYQGVNLKNEIPFFLYESEKTIIEQLKDRKDIKLDLKYVLDREILKYTYGFQSEAMELLCEHFKIQKISIAQLEIENPNLLIEEKEKKINHFRTLVIKDIRTAIDSAYCEKHLKELLLGTGSYIKMTTKTQKGSDGKRKKIGFEVTTQKNMKLYIPFHELGMDFKQITTTLMFNARNKRRSTRIKSELESYERKKKIEENVDVPMLYIHRVQLLLSLYMEGDESTKKLSKIPEKLASKYDITRSELYDITTFKSEDVTFVDYGDRIALKRSSNGIGSVISDMLDVVVLKGWDLETVKITGSNSFVSEAKRQIDMRIGKQQEQPLDQGFRPSF